MACFFPRVALAAWMLSLPLAAAAEERICGTRWLEQHRASFPAPAAKAVGTSQELGPIEVGTQLAFYAPLEPVLKLATCRYKGDALLYLRRGKPVGHYRSPARCG